MVADEKEVASAFLRENPTFGFPYAVRCDFCRESRTLFRDESDAPFEIDGNGWSCARCNVRASTQEIRF